MPDTHQIKQTKDAVDLINNQKPRPIDIKFLQKTGILTVIFDTDEQFEMSAEYLRVHSPSAEVRGHGAGQEVLQIGKKDVMIINIDPVGNYGVKLVFNDGHASGIYSWDTLYELGINQALYWQNYLQRLEKAGIKRD